MNNSDIARVFSEIADMLEIQGGNQFRIRSYRQAQRTIGDLTEPLAEKVKNGEKLTELPGIGKSHAEKIKEIVETGTCERLEELRKDFPEHLTRLMSVPGLGAKKVALLHKELGISSIDDLEKAARGQRIRDLEGMGAKTEENILKGIATLEASAGRISIKEAADRLEDIGKHLDDIDEIDDWAAAGSFRRWKETIGDLDILIQASDRSKATERILDYDSIDEVLAKGGEKVFVKLNSGLEVDFRFFKKESFGSALMYFTGSKAHNIEFRKRAQKKGWKLNEYGLFEKKKRLAGKSEEEVYAKVGLAWVPPELRENRGEIDAAERNELPRLIEVDDIRGELHAHTKETDGTATIEEMAEAAKEMGYDYLAITDHSQAVSVTQGLDEKRLAKHVEAIRRAAAKQDGLLLLAGIEVDIMKDGSLDLSKESLSDLDWVVASVHSYFNLSKKEMTNRLIRAVESGVVDCLGHPLGRMIGSRDPMDFDVDEVFAACRENGVALEINSHPDRLDLPDTHCHRAKELGAKLAITTDAHKTDGLKLIRYGVGVARRGWIEKDDVVNTLSKSELKKKLGLYRKKRQSKG
jgi:DNA polymerase (family 10)